MKREQGENGEKKKEESLCEKFYSREQGRDHYNLNLLETKFKPIREIKSQSVSHSNHFLHVKGMIQF